MSYKFRLFRAGPWSEGSKPLVLEGGNFVVEDCKLKDDQKIREVERKGWLTLFKLVKEAVKKADLSGLNDTQRLGVVEVVAESLQAKMPFDVLEHDGRAANLLKIDFRDCGGGIWVKEDGIRYFNDKHEDKGDITTSLENNLAMIIQFAYEDIEIESKSLTKDERFVQLKVVLRNRIDSLGMDYKP